MDPNTIKYKFIANILYSQITTFQLLKEFEFMFINIMRHKYIL